MSKALQLTNREILKLKEGLAALDGIADKDGRVLRFELSDSLVWNVCKNRTIIDRAAETYEVARRKIAAKYGVVERMTLNSENAAKIAAYMEGESALLDRTNELLGLLKIRRAELQSAGVKVPGILLNLMPLMEE